MRRHSLLIATLLPVALWAGILASPVSGAGSGAATQSYIVTFQGLMNAGAQADSLQGLFGFRTSFRYSHAILGFAARLTQAQATAIAALPFVQSVGLDGTVQATDTAPVAPGDSAPTGVRRIGGATSVVAHAAAGVAVAVVDTGVDFNHPDLSVMNGVNCVSSGSPAQDDNGHGTHVSGTIGARNNGAGVVGVAPGTTIYAVKVLNSQGSGSWSQIICGLDWVAANAASRNIKVVNMSLGGSGSNSPNCGNSASPWSTDSLHKAICNTTNAGVTIVVAAGNGNANQASSVPAAYPEVLTVTAVGDSDGIGGGLSGPPGCRTGEADDRYASFSNYAASGDTTQMNHTIAAPGVCILSTTLGGGYAGNWSGTSMASPHAAGAVALCIKSGVTNGPCAGLSPAQVIQKMRDTALSHAVAVPSDGFTGQPGRYYGDMVWAGADLGGGPSATVPGAPSLGTPVAGNGTVNLTWTAAQANGSTVTNYKVYRGPSSGGETLLTTLGNVTGFADSGLTNGSTYYYKISAVNGVGEGPQSNERAAAPAAVTVSAPGTPNLTSAIAGNGQVALAWAAPASDGGAAISGYKVYRATAPGGEGSTPYATLGVVLGYTDPAATNGTAWYYTVAAVNSAGTGPQSNERSATPSAGNTPGAPSLTATTRTFQHGIQLTWTAPAANGSPITTYQIWRGSTSGSEVLVNTIGPVTSYLDLSTAAFQTAYYKIKAVNEAGPGPFSNEASAFSW